VPWDFLLQHRRKQKETRKGGRKKGEIPSKPQMAAEGVQHHGLGVRLRLIGRKT